MKNKKLIKHLSKNNNYNYNLLKMIEECNELATILTQHLTKDCNYNSKIIEEIGDVKFRLKVIENLFGKKKINKRMKFKINKCKEYIKNGKYKNEV